MIRDNKLEEDDTDIRVKKEDFHKILQNIELLASRGFSVARVFQHPGGFSPEITLARKGERLDIFTYELRGDEAWWLSYDTWSGGPEHIPHHVPAKHFLKLDTINFEGLDWLIPSEVDEYLTRAYGDWHIPVSDWDYTKDPKCIDWEWEIK